MSNENNNCKSCKSKIHLGWVITVLILIIVILFTRLGYGNENLVSQLGFGATLSGIILSVIAIIITIIGETKSDNTKDNLLNISTKLADFNDRFDKYKEVLEQSTERLEQSTERLEQSTENFSELGFIKNKVDTIDQSMKKFSEFVDINKGINNTTTSEVKDNILIEMYEQYSIKRKDNIMRDITIYIYCYLNSLYKTNKIAETKDMFNNVCNIKNEVYISAIIGFGIPYSRNGGEKFKKYIQDIMIKKYNDEYISIEKYFRNMDEEDSE